MQLKANEILSALNHMSHNAAGADGEASFWDALRSRVLRLHSENVPPEDLSEPQEALRLVLGSAASVYAGTKCTMRPYVEEKISWLVEGCQPVPNSNLLESSLSEEIIGLHSTFVEKPASVRARRQEEKPPCIYGDPAFKDRKSYTKFVNQLFVRGRLRWGTTVMERISAFCVEKKGDRLRLTF